MRFRRGVFPRTAGISASRQNAASAPEPVDLRVIIVMLKGVPKPGRRIGFDRVSKLESAVERNF
jgi:hypothetical protein